MRPYFEAVRIGDQRKGCRTFRQFDVEDAAAAFAYRMGMRIQAEVVTVSGAGHFDMGNVARFGKNRQVAIHRCARDGRVNLAHLLIDLRRRGVAMQAAHGVENERPLNGISLSSIHYQ